MAMTYEEQVALVREALRTGRPIRGTVTADVGTEVPLTLWDQIMQDSGVSSEDIESAFDAWDPPEEFYTPPEEAALYLAAEQDFEREFENIKNSFQKEFVSAPTAPAPNKDPLVVLVALNAAAIREALLDDALDHHHSLHLEGVHVADLLDLRRLTLRPSLSFSRCIFESSARFDNADIGKLSLLKCEFGNVLPTNPNHAVPGDGMRTGELFLEGSHAQGNLVISYCKAAQFNLTDAKLEGGFHFARNAGHLNASNMTLQGHLRIIRASTANLSGMDHKGQAVPIWGELNDPEKRHIISFDDGESKEINGEAYWDDRRIDSCHFTESIVIRWDGGLAPSLTDSRFDRDLGLIGNIPEESHLNARRVTIHGRCYLPHQENPSHGKIILDRANIGELCLCETKSQLPIKVGPSTALDDLSPTPGIAITRQWIIGTISTHTEPRDSDIDLHSCLVDFPEQDLTDSTDFFARLTPSTESWLKDWLPNEVPFRIQPWIEFARIAKESGQEGLSDALLIEAADRRLRGDTSWLKRTIWRPLSRFTISYGYHPGRALGLLVLTWLVAAMLVSADHSSFGKTGDAPANAPGLWGWLYALDVVISPVSTGQSDLWIAKNWWLALALWALKAIAWGLGAMFVAGATGWVKPRDSEQK